jgi:hypothetical protein
MLTGIEAAVARDELHQLVYRYAWYLDSRDIDALVALFVPETQVAADLHATFSRQLTRLGPTTLLVGNHIVDFDTDDERLARGIVYTRCYAQTAAGFIEQMIVYSDRYRRDDIDGEGRWRFVGRKHELFYGVATAEQPFAQEPADWPVHDVGTGTIPFRLPTWQAFTRSKEHPGA